MYKNTTISENVVNSMQVQTVCTRHSLLSSGVGSNCVLWGPQIQVVGVALIIEFCDYNILF